MEEIRVMNSIKDILNIKCEQFKDKVAFLEKDDKLKKFIPMTYGKLKEEINGLGTVMLKKLKLSDKKIAVIGENSIKWYQTYMAVACGVGVIVPLDKELPENEILNLLNRAECKAIVYSSRKKEMIENIKDKLPKDMVFIEMGKEKSDKISYSYNELVKEGCNLVDTGEDEYINLEIDREKFSILLFTSGTTAEAKGVMLSHKNICANIYSAYNIVPMFGKYTCLSILPMHHTYEMTLSYLLMTSLGGTIAICEGLKYVSKNIKEIKPDFLVVVPALIEVLSKKIDKRVKEQGKENVVKFIGKFAGGLNKIGIDIRKSVFKEIHESFGGNLKYIFCGAAPLDKDLAKKMERYGFTFLQGYGLTECSPLIAGNTLKDREPGTVGKAVYGDDIRIDLSGNNDENSNIGEIMVKGDNIFLGYYKDEKETKKVLKKGWFYTGDIGYFDLRGNLVVTGRSKNVIVTSNGKKIFPEELENLLNKINLVEESMVYGKKAKENSNELIVTARVTLNEEYIEETYASTRPTNEEIYNMIWEEIKKINRMMVPYKAIKKLEIKDEQFIKTTTMKIKRFEEIKGNK